MPKPTKLHAKGKSNSIQKPCKMDKETSDGADPEESMRQFQLELCWCIQQLERTLNEKKGNEKQLQETWKVLTVLKNNNQPVIRKRQLMRTHFGDYRAKMAAEEKKLVKLASKIKISETPDKPKATFLRKSAFLTTGDSSFRFDFDLNPEQMDNNISNSDNTTNLNTTDGNTDLSSNDGNIKRCLEDVNTAKSNEDNLKRFKFSFSGSEFKFNFNVGNSYTLEDLADSVLPKNPETQNYQPGPVINLSHLEPNCIVYNNIGGINENLTLRTLPDICYENVRKYNE